MATAFFDRNRATATSQWSSYPGSPVVPTIAPLPIDSSPKVALLTRFTHAWAMVERTFEAIPISALMRNDDQWGQTVRPDVANILERTWEQAALVASHIARYSPPGKVLLAASAVRLGAVDLLFNLYYVHREIAQALPEIDEPLLQPTRVAVRSIRAQLESLIQYYHLSTELLRRFKTTQPCRNNPKCYPWRSDRIW